MDRRLTMNFSALSLFQAMLSRVKDKKASQQKSLVSSDAWATMSTTVASVMFAWAIVCQYSPHEVRGLVNKLKRSIRDYLDREVTISFHEACAERFKRGEAYAVVEAYLASIATHDSKRLRAEMESPDSEILLSMAEHQEITDVFLGIKFVWTMNRTRESQNTPYHERASRGQRFYVVRFHRRHRRMATGEYLKHVVRGGKEARAEKRGRKLYTNVAGGTSKATGMVSSRWSHVAFEHPARLENMALEPAVRDDIREDLLGFAGNREFYERAGKAWKRGYLLYGPPGTGKSTMVAAMANLLNYDVYDLELTAVKDNTELRQLLIDTASKSVVVVEDIDCSLDLTAQRAKKPESQSEGEEKKASRVTLSGLLNVIDGIWSACGGERVIVFTTNHIEKLDPALIRSGRMDKHIELSYCTFEGFKVLAKNYLGVESHCTFDEIERLIQEVEITPADVGESLLPRSPRDLPERCLSNLVRALEKAKELARDKKIAAEVAEEEMKAAN